MMTASWEAPTAYALKGDGMAITFVTSAADGQPELTYEAALGRRRYRGDEIRVEPAAVGTLVTVSIRYVPDHHGETLTLILPDVNLAEAAVELETAAILTTHRTSFAGPGLVKGALQSYQVVRLTGEARAVAG